MQGFVSDYIEFSRYFGKFQSHLFDVLLMAIDRFNYKFASVNLLTSR